jgi:hypothetical protein
MRFRKVLLFLAACAAIQPAGASAQAVPAQTPRPAAAQARVVQSIEINYRNTKYGFCFYLPESWRGYTIVAEQWNGTILSSGQAVQGPQLLIRNPKWTKEAPYQDIPIMAFTPAEWQHVEAVTMSVSAAPIGPSELGHNSRYVFALPPRWIGFDDALGQDELNAWMSQNRLQASCGKTAASLGKNIP